ncbi:acetoacetate--CoA ligase (plasmid) [Rhodococcus rhodochrous]|nr:acetoacetate--CoA ligase [Rhodococcus rhodochrous]
MWEPSDESIANTRVGAYCQWLRTNTGLSFDDYWSLWKWSTTDTAAFWRSIWDFFEVIGDGDTTEVLSDVSMPGTRWFPHVRVNYAENALRGRPDQVVVTGLSQTRPQQALTRGELTEQVGRVANGLRQLGVLPGDRVAAYLPNIPETLVAMLATASLGAVWAACAPELGPRSVLDRLQQLEPKVLLTIDGYAFGKKQVDRREDVATIRAGLPTTDTVVHIPYLTSESLPDTVAWSELLEHPAELTFERVPFDHPLWVLFSSGTTGLPKAIVHSHGGIILELNKALALHSDLGAKDRYFVYCTTTWVMWNIQVSALLTGASIVTFDGDPMYPDISHLWRIVDHLDVTVFGAGAAYLMGCRKAGFRPNEHFQFRALRGIFSTGSPLPPDGFRWVYGAVRDDVLLQSTSGGTDVCTSFVGGTPMLPVRAGEITAPALGVLAQAWDETGTPVIGQTGELVIVKPMPSMPVYFWNDPDGSKYRSAYFDHFPGFWRHGDWVTFNDRGGCTINGRSDGTLNRGGIRLGTSEFYAALEDESRVADSLVVHIEDQSGGMGRLILFVQLTEPGTLDTSLKTQLIELLRTRLSPRHTPDDIVEIPEVPYNLTGKKLEVPVKRILGGTPRTAVVSDGAVRNPESLNIFESLVTTSPDLCG